MRALLFIIKHLKLFIAIEELLKYFKVYWIVSS